jgi:hypothetical protein
VREFSQARGPRRRAIGGAAHRGGKPPSK